jgi:hypothetical protein
MYVSIKDHAANSGAGSCHKDIQVRRAKLIHLQSMLQLPHFFRIWLSLHSGYSFLAA